jgi:hypothetical protein
MFGLTSSKSFIELGYAINAVLFTKKQKEVPFIHSTHLTKQIPLVIVGSKADKKTERAVSGQMGTQLASLCSTEFFEVSVPGTTSASQIVTVGHREEKFGSVL